MAYELYEAKLKLVNQIALNVALELDCSMPRTVREKLSLHVITKHASDADIREIVDLGCLGFCSDFTHHANPARGIHFSMKMGA